MFDSHSISISRRTLLAGTVALASTQFFPRATHAAQPPGFPLIVDLEWLSTAATEPDLRLFDVAPLHTWRNGHIDSAQHAWWRDTVDPNYSVFGAVLTQGDEQAHRQRVLDSLDLRAGDRVVVYDNMSGFRAARLVWFLRFLGFGQAALLDADFDDWQRSPFPIESASTSSTSPVVDPQQGFYLVTQQVLDRLSDPRIQLIDSRTDSERTSDLGGTMPTGSIPGSRRLPWNRLIDETGRLRPVADILALLTSLALALDRPTILYGRFGVDTALPWLVLRNAGMNDLQTYDRGWAEWSITPDLPREPLS